MNIARPRFAGRGGKDRFLPNAGALCFAFLLNACASDVHADDSLEVMSQSLEEKAASAEFFTADVSTGQFEAFAIDPSTMAGAVQVFPDEVFTDLDYGLYWYGVAAGETEGSYVKADEANNPFYDPSRPTVIHIHGWQNGSIAEFWRDDFDHRRRSGSVDVDKDIAEPWLEQGYNVGMLYWTNFADERNVGDAESKIWSSQGSSGLRYRVRRSADRNDNATELRDFEGDPNASVSSLLADSLVAAMADFEGDSFRLTGHSLGNQVAIAVAGHIHDRLQDGVIDNHKLLPTRIALLDPYYSGSRLRGLSDTTANLAADIMEDLKSSDLGTAPVVFEAYRSSLLAVGNGSPVLERGNAAIVSLRPSYYSFWQIAQKHQVGYWWYFWGKQFDVPAADDDGSILGLSASASYEDVKTYMDSPKFLDQETDAASRTKSPSDDLFMLKNR